MRAVNFGRSEQATLVDGAAVPALVVVWARDEVERWGEVMIPAPESGVTPYIFGRATDDQELRHLHLPLYRIRPTSRKTCPPIVNHFISRVQLEVFRANATTLRVKNVGKCPMLVNGMKSYDGMIREGDLVELYDEVMFYCTLRHQMMQTFQHIHRIKFGFGESDEWGVSGESFSLWNLRSQIIASAASVENILLQDDVGVLSETVARAIHQQEWRHASSSTAKSLQKIDSHEFFRSLLSQLNRRLDANAIERCISEKLRGSTLYLENIDGLSLEEQEILARMLSAGPFGRKAAKSSETSSSFAIKIVASVKSSLGIISPDLRALFGASIVIPAIQEHREDIPILVRQCLRQMYEREPVLFERFNVSNVAQLERRISTSLIAALLRWNYTKHVHEMHQLLLESIHASPGHFLEPSERLMGKRLPQRSVQLAEIPQAHVISLLDADPLTLLLELFRKRRFSIRSVAKDPIYPGTKTELHRDLQRIMGKKLAQADWNLQKAAQLMSCEGETSSLTASALLRLQEFIDRIQGKIHELGYNGAIQRAESEFGRFAAEPVIAVYAMIQSRRQDSTS